MAGSMRHRTCDNEHATMSIHVRSMRPRSVARQSVRRCGLCYAARPLSAPAGARSASPPGADATRSRPATRNPHDADAQRTRTTPMLSAHARRRSEPLRTRRVQTQPRRLPGALAKAMCRPARSVQATAVQPRQHGDAREQSEGCMARTLSARAEAPPCSQARRARCASRPDAGGWTQARHSKMPCPAFWHACINSTK
eukprot:5622222-Pleurochrysis_carterae.AAC.1